ncbi:hypothetical protein ABIA35_008999 [Catenulispora sp. MAP12-49]
MATTSSTATNKRSAPTHEDKAEQSRAAGIKQVRRGRPPL